MKRSFPFRIGTTSYIIPANILPNVNYLANQVDDIELVLFEVDDGPNNLPLESDIKELNILSAHFNLSYTVHLPLDLRFASNSNEQHTSLIKAKRVIDRTSGLHPWAYVLHLDGKEEISKKGADWKERWDEQAIKALEIVTAWVGDKKLLAAENLDNYPINFIDEAVARSGISRCIDIGHLWKDHHDPVQYLEQHLDHARVIHIHGIDHRDHQSLIHMPESELRRVMDYLVKKNYQGVMTIEVFSDEDFRSSLQVIHNILDTIK